MKTPLTLLAGVVLGVLLLVAVRLVVASPPEHPHYHANLALFVDGERFDLSGDEFMEDVSACVGHGAVQPRARVHLHNNEQDVVHVHHDGVTWGHLFTNLGLSLGDRHLGLPGGRILVAGEEGRTAVFILNGRPEFAVHNRLIAPGDRLLVSFGTEGEEEALRTQFPQVASDAPRYDEMPDPAACAGAHTPGAWDRLRHALVG